MWALFALHRTVARVCARLVPVCWFGGKKNLAIRKTVGVFKAKAAIPSHFRLRTSASFRENLHRGPHRVFRSQAEQTFLFFFLKELLASPVKAAGRTGKGFPLASQHGSRFGKPRQNLLRTPSAAGQESGLFFFFLLRF